MLREHVDIRPIVVNDFVLNGDVGDIYRLINVSDVAARRVDVAAQNRLAYETNIDKIIVSWTNIEFDIDASANRSAFIDNSAAARRQRSPANLIAAGAPGNPGRSPFQIAAREPNPSKIFDLRPATVVISRPTKVFIGDPGPTVVGVGPITVGVRTPIRITHGHFRLPAVAVIFDVNPASAGHVIVEEIDRNLSSVRPRNRRQKQSEQR